MRFVALPRILWAASDGVLTPRVRPTRNLPCTPSFAIAILEPELNEVIDAGWFSLFPPLLAIAVALIFRSVIPALFLGIWMGAWGIVGLDLAGLGQALLETLSVHVRGALADADHAAVILFTFMIGGLVGIITRSGGMQGIVDILIRKARSRRDGQVTTVFMGLAVFIDDYANSLIVGQTMRGVTDRLKISREKLAYIVDSMAAPVSGVALVTTWIGYQVGLIGDAVSAIDGLDTAPYLVFLHSLAYSFYPWLAMFLVMLVAWTGRDIGPMVAAERRAIRQHAEDEPVAPTNTAEPQIAAAVVPLVVLVVGVIVGLVATGEGDTVREIIGSASTYKALMWASMVAVLVAIAIPLVQARQTLTELMDGWTEGVQSMLPTMTILVLAWALSGTTEQLGTAAFLVSILGDSLAPQWIPTVVFGLAAATAFATGTSWGTMGILVPLVVPLAYHLAPESPHIFSSSIAAVLAGAIWGDHCSPISDTTILSSMASGCDHMAHVRTQLPYALLAGGAAVLFGVLPSGFGWPWWLCLGLGILVLVVVMRVWGVRVEAEKVGI